MTPQKQQYSENKPKVPAAASQKSKTQRKNNNRPKISFERKAELDYLLTGIRKIMEDVFEERFSYNALSITSSPVSGGGYLCDGEIWCPDQPSDTK